MKNEHKDSAYENDNNYQKQSLVKVIPQAQGPQKLDEIYNAITLYNNKDKNSNTKSSEQILLYLKFPGDCEKVNPHNPNSVYMASDVENSNHRSSWQFGRQRCVQACR